MSEPTRSIVLVQLPIPPPGPQAVEGNVPLAAANLKVFAERQGLGDRYRIELLPPALCNRLGDAGLVAELLARGPWLVGFSCLPEEHELSNGMGSTGSQLAGSRSRIGVSGLHGDFAADGL